jgi:hypothetical protein
MIQKIFDILQKQAYKAAERVITGGLSLGSRIVLGLGSALMALMLLSAAEGRGSVLYYLPGAFCLLITFACFTAGRVRQFLGSCIGIGIFGACLFYLLEDLTDRALWTGERPFSTVQSLTIMMLAGVPGAAYAARVRFGFRKPPSPQSAGLSARTPEQRVATPERKALE